MFTAKVIFSFLSNENVHLLCPCDNYFVMMMLSLNRIFKSCLFSNRLRNNITGPWIAEMFAIIVKLLLFSSVINTVYNCYQCFIDVDDSLRLCWGHILTEYNIRNVDSCFHTLDRIFNNESRVTEAGKVGKN